MCGAVVYSANGVCEVCDPRRGPAEALNASIKPRRHWTWYARKFATAAIPVVLEVLVEVGVTALTNWVIRDSDDTSNPMDDFDDSRRGYKSASPSSRSALRAGRMRQTDRIKGPDSPLPNKPGIYHHINKETGAREYVGQTNDLRTRQQQHARSGKLDTDTQFVRFAEARDDATKDDLCQTEIDHIARHHPSGNTTRGGNGRR